MPKPNIVFILVDDLGWRDLGCYGSTFYETPNLDRLAAQGMRFTDAYASCPVCSPTRASILTGRYPARVGVTDYIDWSGSHHPSRGRLIDAPYIDHLPLSETSLATALREGGYRTWHVGKWHLGGPEFHPDQHGFDINLGGCEWGLPTRGYFSPYGLPTLEDGPPGEYLTDRLTDEAVRLIRGSDERPFFLNLCHYAVHTPIQAPDELVDKYRDKARAQHLDGLHPFVEGEPFPSEHKRHLRVKRRVLQSDPAYAAMVENLDWNVGRVLAALEACGKRGNTLVVFTSDNGGLSSAEGSPTCNLPLQEGKGWMYEGGTREPLLVAWPGRVRPGSVCSVPVSSPDFYPTFLEAAGLALRPGQHCDGRSLLPLLGERGGEELRERPLFWHYPHYGNQGGTPGCSVRRGDMKLIEFFEDRRLELYNLREDVSESRNLVTQKPDVAADLRELLHAWRDQVAAVLPEANPDWRE
jgi:arylsulfatase A-like enzyme